MESFQVFANQVTYAWVVILVTALLRVFSDYICNYFATILTKIFCAVDMCVHTQVSELYHTMDVHVLFVESVLYSWKFQGLYFQGLYFQGFCLTSKYILEFLLRVKKGMVYSLLSQFNNHLNTGDYAFMHFHACMCNSLYWVPAQPIINAIR